MDANPISFFYFSSSGGADAVIFFFSANNFRFIELQENAFSINLSQVNFLLLFKFKL